MNSQRVPPYVIKDQSFTTLSSGKTSRFKRTSNQNSRSKSHSNRQSSTQLSKFYVKNPFKIIETPENNCDEKGFKQIKHRIFQSSAKNPQKETVSIIRQKIIQVDSPANKPFNLQQHRNKVSSIKTRTLSGYQQQKKNTIEYLNSNLISKTKNEKEFSLQLQYYKILRQNQEIKEQNERLKTQFQHLEEKLKKKQQCLKCNQTQIKYGSLKISLQNVLHQKYQCLTTIEVLEEKVRKYQKEICDITRQNQHFLKQTQEMRAYYQKQMTNLTKNNSQQIKILKKAYKDSQEKNKILEQIVNERSSRQKKKLKSPQKIQLRNSSELFYLTDSDGNQ